MKMIYIYIYDDVYDDDDYDNDLYELWWLYNDKAPVAVNTEQECESGHRFLSAWKLIHVPDSMMRMIVMMRIYDNEDIW